MSSMDENNTDGASQREIRLEVKKTRRGKLLTFADSDAPGGIRAMTDAEMKAHDYIKNLTSEFQTDDVEPGVVGYVRLDGDELRVDWCSDEARDAAGGAA